MHTNMSTYAEGVAVVHNFIQAVSDHTYSTNAFILTLLLTYFVDLHGHVYHELKSYVYILLFICFVM